MKSSTIWVSMKTKELADQMKGRKSYNKFFMELMEGCSGVRPVQPAAPAVTNREDVLMERVKELLTNVTLCSLEREKMRELVKEEVERQVAFQQKKNIFSHLV